MHDTLSSDRAELRIRMFRPYEDPVATRAYLEGLHAEPAATRALRRTVDDVLDVL